MNSQVAKKRIGDVIRVDTITNSQADFLATHVEVKNIQMARSYDGKAEQTLSEREALERYVMNPGNMHQLILVVGLSGTGKSHLIRWFSACLERDHPDDEVVLFIRRSDNSLKGTIKQLLQLDEVAQIPNRDVYERLTRATAVIDDKKLKDMIYQNFIVEINNDENNDILTHHKKKRLTALLKNESFQEQLLEDDRAIDRIYQKVAQGRGPDNRDVVALFDAEDFTVDAAFCDSLRRNGADRNAVTMATSLVGDEEFSGQVAAYMNTLVNNVIQTCTGLEPGDFEEVFKEIRRELKRQGKSLTLLIEDITAFTGVNVALLNVISLPNTGLYDDLCRISSVIGTTTAYFEDVFPANYRDRVTNYMRISDEAFGADPNSLYEFVGRYLNAMSLTADTLEEWMDAGAQPDLFPVHEDAQGRSWERVAVKNGKSLNLFPFTRTSITKLYSLLPAHQQTPRYMLRDVVERVVRNYLMSPKTFPSLNIDRIETYPWEIHGQMDHSARLRQFVSGDEFRRMDRFIRIWGNANLFSYTDAEGKKYLGGIPEEAYDEFSMTRIPGIENGGALAVPAGQEKSAAAASGGTATASAGGTIAAPVQAGVVTSSGTAAPVQAAAASAAPVVSGKPSALPGENNVIPIARATFPQGSTASPAQINFELGRQTIYRWIEGGTLTFDSTKGDSKMMQQARDAMNQYIYNAINWQIEGVSIDNISRFTNRNFVEFERQTRKVGKALVVLPANPETQSVLEAFLAYVTLGEGTSWNFAGSVWRQYQVQLWFENIKPEIIRKVKTFNGIEVDYQKCAIAAEMIREIVFGQYKGTTVTGMEEELLWKKMKKEIPTNSGHSKEWLSLMVSMNGDADRVKDTILDYYNIVQGTGGKNKFLNHAALARDFKKVRKNRLKIDADALEVKDPVKPRQDIRVIYRDIQSKLQKVSESEQTLARRKLEALSAYIDPEDFDEDDLSELVETLSAFYEEINKAQVNVQQDTAKIDAIRKDKTAISNAVARAVSAMDLDDPLDILMAFSQDPMKRIDNLLNLLTKAANDMEYVEREVASRRAKISQSGKTAGIYAAQQTMIEADLSVVESWEE